MTRLINQFNLKCTRAFILLSVFCFVVAMNSVQPVQATNNEVCVCAPQVWKKIKKKAKSASKKVSSTAHKAAKKTSQKVASTAHKAASSSAVRKMRSTAKSAASKTGQYAKKAAVATGKGVYKAATSSTGKKVGQFVVNQAKDSRAAKLSKGLRSKTAKNFYKDPKAGLKYAVKSGIHKATTNPGKYVKNFAKNRFEETKVGKVYKYGDKALKTSVGKKVKGYVKSTAASKKAVKWTNNAKKDVKHYASNKAKSVAHKVVHKKHSPKIIHATYNGSAKAQVMPTHHTSSNKTMTKEEAKKKLKSATNDALRKIFHSK
ncbi:MAG TPA: hypothetical protein PLK40_03300 [Bacteroidaceae bacterium]|nr:hypothetical protein [Bacteroidaceae bacterium]